MHYGGTVDSVFPAWCRSTIRFLVSSDSSFVFTIVEFGVGVVPDCHGATQNGSGSSSVTSPALVLVETPNESVCGGTVVSTKMNAVIAVVVLVFICLVVVILRYMYRYKGTYHTNEAKGTEFAETADVALRSDPALQDAMDESKKEYFI
ncbi:hypothetical protein NFI96_016235 [Prochilodus magdalenae]|nr:hypothetical protein NFI96_016235 [Prochilodus magdalenae]